MDVTSPTKQTRGRPCEYKPEYCDLVVDLGSQGCSKAEMADACNAYSYETLTGWAEKFEDFSEALKRACMKSRAWWEKQGRVGVFDTEGQRLNGTYVKQMAARFPDSVDGLSAWREQKDLKVDAKVETTVVDSTFASRPDGN